MALTNAERQARHRAKVKEKAVSIPVQAAMLNYMLAKLVAAIQSVADQS